MNRSERDSARKKSIAVQSNLKVVAIVTLCAGVLYGILSSSAGTISLVKSNHDCSQTECSYEVSVTNTDDFSRKGFLRVNGFITVYYGEAKTRQQVGTHRVEYSVSSEENKIIRGKFKVTKKPTTVTFTAGQIGESI